MTVMMGGLSVKKGATMRGGELAWERVSLKE